MSRLYEETRTGWKNKVGRNKQHKDYYGNLKCERRSTANCGSREYLNIPH